MLDQILEKIKEEKKIAEQDLDAVDPRVISYKKGQVSSSKERLEGLYLDYKNEILKRSVFILVTGEDSDKFTKIATKKFKCFSLEADVMFTEIVDQLSPQLYENKTLSSSVFDIIGNVLENRMKQLDIVSYNSLMFSSKFSRTIKDKQEMIQAVREAVSEVIGGEVIGMDALERVSKDAVNKNYKSRIVPILLRTDDEQFIMKMSDSIRLVNPRVVRVAAGKIGQDINAIVSLNEVTEEQVGEALKQIATQS